MFVSLLHYTRGKALSTNSGRLGGQQIRSGMCVDDSNPGLAARRYADRVIPILCLYSVAFSPQANYTD
jgi:hypothetical protein